MGQSLSGSLLRNPFPPSPASERTAWRTSTKLVSWLPRQDVDIQLPCRFRHLSVFGRFPSKRLTSARRKVQEKHHRAHPEPLPPVDRQLVPLKRTREPLSSVPKALHQRRSSVGLRRQQVSFDDPKSGPINIVFFSLESGHWDSLQIHRFIVVISSS